MSAYGELTQNINTVSCGRFIVMSTTWSCVFDTVSHGEMGNPGVLKRFHLLRKAYHKTRQQHPLEKFYINALSITGCRDPECP